MADVAVTVTLHLVDKVLNSLHQEPLQYNVEEIKRHLSSMQACLLDAEGGVGSEVMKNLVEQIRDVSREMEDVLDEFMMHTSRSSSKSQFLQFAHSLKHWLPLRGLQSQIACIRSKTSSITTSQPFGELLRSTSSSRDGLHTQPRVLEDIVEEDEVLGIDLVKQNLISLLSDGDSRCKTVSVVGPGGSGKTVLVNSVYKNKRVIGQFDCHAWLSVPHSTTFEQLLQNMLSQFCAGANGVQFSHSDVPMKNLKHYLQGKRYIIVLDYVWRDQDWTYIKSLLPDDFNGSRIVITTRYDDVATICSPSENLIFRINGLEWKQSWRLFCKKAFGNDSGECPPYLQDVSERIVKRCEGLPQAISAVGSLLSRKPKLPEEWIRVHDNLGREMQLQANCINTMLLPSYYDLPSNRKSCLLYFSIFPEDYSIKRDRLIRLWVSEGFIKKSGSEPLEKIAEDYLNELVARNLVKTCSRDFSGRVRSCRVLNLVREFICIRCRDEKFAAVVTDTHMDPEDKTRIRRLSIEDASSGLTGARGLQLTAVRSLFVFGSNKASSLVIEETLHKVRLLKVLDLENAPLERFPECILEVALLLRYLSLRNTKVDLVPKNIKRLRYLEYLDLKQTQITWLPEEISLLQNLQHLLVYRCNPIKYDAFHRLQGADIVGEIRVLPLMQKLSIIKVSRSSPRFFEMLGQLTLLKKLGLVDLKVEDGELLCSCIEKMQNLSTLDVRSISKEEYLDLHHISICPAFLRHLYLKGRLTILPKWIPSLNGLVRLLLRWSRLSTDPVALLQLMPNLMELELIDAFTGDIIFFDTGGFPKLKTLYIEQLDSLDTMVVLGGAMPVLQKLTIVRCLNLWDLPSGFEQLRGLEDLLVYDMPLEFTSRLGRNSQDRFKINHVPVIHSFSVGANGSWIIQNFS